MTHCAVPIALRKLKLYQKLPNNNLYWNPEGFFDTSIAKKITVSLKLLKRSKQMFRSKFCIGKFKNFVFLVKNSQYAKTLSKTAQNHFFW